MSLPRVLTAAAMREVDRRTAAAGIPGLILMENAAHGVVRVLAEHYAPLAQQRILIVCGKGHNGGDGLAIARLLHVLHRPATLHVVLVPGEDELQGDAAANLRMLRAVGVPVSPDWTVMPTLIIDAVLGTGFRPPLEGAYFSAVERISVFAALGVPVVSVDIPSGLASDGEAPSGPYVHATHTVTFTAWKPSHVLSPNCDLMGRLHLAPIGSADELIATPDHWLSLNHPRGFADLLAPRHPESHKGTYGHVLAIAGSRGKTGAAAMTGLAALRAGAGLVTVASAGSAAPLIASYAPEIMTASLPEDDEGTITASALDHLDLLRAGKTVLALGPGLNLTAGITELVADLYSQCALPLIVDADALNALGTVLLPANGPRILTPHPGEMARLLDTTTAQVQADRLNTARQFAQDRNCVLVLKGHRTLIAQPNGCVVVNSTGTPALGKGGSGDVLTGLIAGFVAQFPKHPDRSVLAAVWLHGYAAQLATATWGDKSLLATDLLTCLPEALAHARRLSHE